MVARAYVIEQVCLATYTVVVFSIAVVQLRLSLMRNIRSLLKKRFHRYMPVHMLIMACICVDPHGVWGIYNRLTLSIFRVLAAGSTIFVMVMFLTILTQAAYIATSTQLGDQPDLPFFYRWAFKATFVVQIMVDTVVAVGKNVDPDNTTFDAVRFIFIACEMVFIVGCVTVLQIRLRSAVKAQALESGSVAQAANRSMDEALLRLKRVCYFGLSTLPFIIGLEVLAAKRSLDGEVDKQPLRGEDRDTYHRQYVFPIAIQMFVIVPALWIAWEPLEDTSSGSKHSGTGSKRAGSSPRNQLGYLSNRGSATSARPGLSNRAADMAALTRSSSEDVVLSREASNDCVLQLRLQKIQDERGSHGQKSPSSTTSQSAVTAQTQLPLGSGSQDGHGDGGVERDADQTQTRRESLSVSRVQVIPPVPQGDALMTVGDWRADADLKTGIVYYSNVNTGQTSWLKPKEFGTVTPMVDADAVEPPLTTT